MGAALAAAADGGDGGGGYVGGRQPHVAPAVGLVVHPSSASLTTGSAVVGDPDQRQHDRASGARVDFVMA